MIVDVLFRMKDSGIISNIKITVGEGQQTFTWLAKIVEARIKLFKLTRTAFSDDLIIVDGFLNTSGDLINPADRIYEHCTLNGLSVSAEIISSIPSDEHGDPIMSNWMTTAYIKSANGSE